MRFRSLRRWGAPTKVRLRPQLDVLPPHSPAAYTARELSQGRLVLHQDIPGPGNPVTALRLQCFETQVIVS